jgi:hypothetical protein
MVPTYNKSYTMYMDYSENDILILLLTEYISGSRTFVIFLVGFMLLGIHLLICLLLITLLVVLDFLETIEFLSVKFVQLRIDVCAESAWLEAIWLWYEEHMYIL